MRFFRKIAGFLGLGPHNEAHDKNDDDEDHNHNNRSSDDIQWNRTNADPIPAGPRRGFSVPVQVPVDRPVVGPILIPCSGDGGVQGLRWYARRLKTDEDGDVADEFLNEILADTSAVTQDQQKPFPRFQAKYNARHAKVKHQVVTSGGKLQHYVECQGQLQWV